MAFRDAEKLIADHWVLERCTGPTEEVPQIAQAPSFQLSASQPTAIASNEHEFPLILVRRDDQLAIEEAAIHFAAHADLARDVDPGFYREADSRKDKPLFKSLEVVEIGA